jgi:acetolactate synthase-1/2/3 large subunit
MNFPGTHELHMGVDSHSQIGDADVILDIDSDTPWIPAQAVPGKGCRVFYLDIDPLKENIPVWYIPSERFMKADSYTALRQLNKRLETISIDGKA